MPNQSDDYRLLAEECRARAAATKNPDHKRQYQEMAEAWIVLARNAEEKEPIKK
jgi:hypothetical protein